MDTSASIATAKQYLRIKYAKDLTGLRAKWEEIAAGAFDQVVLTGQSFEGGSHTGQLVFPRIAYLDAIQQVLAELDPCIPVAPSQTRYADFGGAFLQV